MPQRDAYDIIVMGGGPAGSTAAALLGAAGRSVLLLDREKFPRFRIGESLMPATYWTLQRLGVLETMAASHFPRKHSVQFFGRSGRASTPFYFFETEDSPAAQTWQVDRVEFDAMLLDNARAKGAEVHEQARVLEVLFEHGRATGVRARLADGSERTLRSRVVVDATGQAGFLARKLDLRNGDPNLRNCSYYTRFRGGRRETGIDEGATLILHTAAERTWFWYIPLPDDTVSVGVVGPIDRLGRGRVADPQAIFDAEAQGCPALLERLADATQIGPIRVDKDFSYASHRIAGDGWVLAGDAFGFLDPMYSTGVFLALKGGELAADAILAAFETQDFSAATLGRHGEEFLAGIDAMRKLVYAFYSRDFNFAEFLKAHPECKGQLVDLLIGNVYRRDVSGLLRAMDEFCDLPDYEPYRLSEPETQPR